MGRSFVREGFSHTSIHYSSETTCCFCSELTPYRANTLRVAADVVPLASFLRWARKNAMAVQFVEMLSHISAVQFGLRPMDRQDEGKLVSDLMTAHALRGLKACTATIVTFLLFRWHASFSIRRAIGIFIN